jgi:DNA polymerase III delta prime subunit
MIAPMSTVPNQMAVQLPPTLFISYSHDSRDHEDRVLALADRLRQDGVDALVDQYNTAPPEGWPLWTDREIQKADFVALVCTENYLRRVEGRENLGKGRGVLWEGRLIYNHLYTADSDVQRFIPIVFEDGARSFIPWPLRGLAYYHVSAGEGYENFFRHVTGQPRHEKPELGKLRALAAMVPQSYAASLEFRPQRTFPSNMDRRNRLQMLKRVRLDWIDGVLQQSLYKVARIDLGLVASSDPVYQPLNTIVQVPDRLPTAMPVGTAISRIFDKHGGALLILGAPGTGKTTLLLELAQDLLDRAEQDESYPIPVVFNLSSWAARRQPLVRWLVTELNERNDVPKRVARQWVETEQILPLLDGLDEVSVEHREACVEAINEFRRDHGLLSIAVCSRSADYDSLGTKLRLRTAVVVQTLARSQVQAYLERVGEPLRSLRQALQKDPTLCDLLETPLLLWVAMLAYRNASLNLSQEGTIEDKRQELFASFVEAMFKRRSANIRFQPEQTTHWLSWLASSLSRNNQTVFYLETLRIEWLTTRRQRWLARALTIVASGAAGGPVLALSFGVTLALLVMLLRLSRVTIHSNPLHWLMLLNVTTQAGMDWAWSYWLSIALSMGMVGAFLNLSPVETIRFTVTGISSRLGKAARLGLLLGFGAWVAACSIFALLFREPVDLEDPRLRAVMELGLSRTGAMIVAVLSASLAFALFVAIIAGLITLFSGEAVDGRRSPNQGTHRSTRAAIGTVALSGLLGVLVFGLFLRDSSKPVSRLIEILGGGFTVGLIVGLVAGGLFSLKHFALRLMLWVEGLAPFRYARFLDSAVERLFLRKVGGGYIFAHRMLRDHFVILARESGVVEKTEAEIQNARHPVSKRQYYRILAFGELILPILFIVLFYQYASSIILRPIVVFVLCMVGWFSLRLRNIGWEGVGLGRPRKWSIALAVGTLCGIVLAITDLYAIVPIVTRVTGKPLHLPSLPTMSVWMALVSVIPLWVMAAADEVAFRGYLMNRLADIGRGTQKAWIVSLILTSVLFGSLSINQGVTGVIEDVVVGFLLGLLYLGSRRNLCSPIVAHGVFGTLQVVLILLGEHPLLRRP